MSVLILTKYTSHEYETTMLFENFNKKNISAQVCQFHNFDIIINTGIFYNGIPFDLPEIVLVRLGAGITPAELAIIRYFELAGIPCINSSHSINKVQDKFETSCALSFAGISVPTTMIAKYPSSNDLVSSNIKFPCIVKVIVGSFGDGVYMCHSLREYVNIIEFAHSLHVPDTLIVQKYLGDHPGVDLRVIVVGDEVVGVMQRTAPVGDFRANISKGGTGTSVPITDKIRDIALHTSKVLGLNIAGIDLLFDGDEFSVCEANSNPGFDGFEKYCNINVADAISSYIKSKIK